MTDRLEIPQLTGSFFHDPILTRPGESLTATVREARGLIEELNAVTGTQWSEGPNGMLTNNDPARGGIIDATILSSEWFVIFNDDDLPLRDGFPDRETAIRAFLDTFA